VKSPYLRSISLAAILLLLTSGIALAQLTLSIQPDCIECCPLPGLGPCPGYTARVTSRGWDHFERLNLILTGPGPAGPFGTFGFFSADDRGRFELQVILLCENPWDVGDEASVQFEDNYWWIHPEWQPADYGRWTLDISGESGSASGSFLFAEDCDLPEFVAEPATMVLLGGGLTALAGYAGVRWRGRKV
jgi:hypothetical protein